MSFICNLSLVQWVQCNIDVPNVTGDALAVSATNVFVGTARGHFLSTINGGRLTTDITGIPDTYLAHACNRTIMMNPDQNANESLTCCVTFVVRIPAIPDRHFLTFSSNNEKWNVDTRNHIETGGKTEKPYKEGEIKCVLQ